MQQPEDLKKIEKLLAQQRADMPNDAHFNLLAERVIANLEAEHARDRRSLLHRMARCLDIHPLLLLAYSSGALSLLLAGWHYGDRWLALAPETSGAEPQIGMGFYTSPSSLHELSSEALEATNQLFLESSLFGHSETMDALPTVYIPEGPVTRLLHSASIPLASSTNILLAP